MYLVTFFPSQINQMSFSSTECRQGEFQVKENPTRVTNFLLKLLLFDFIFFSSLGCKHNDMEIRKAILQLLSVSNLSFWISKSSCFIHASCAHIGWALHKFKKHHLATPLQECQCLNVCSIHLMQL